LLLFATVFSPLFLRGFQASFFGGGAIFNLKKGNKEKIACNMAVIVVKY
jgi:hypothetical protein